MSIYNPTTNYNPPRSGFDRSHRITFSTCGCQLLPIESMFMNKGSKYKVNLANFTQATNLNKSAFARLEEHYDLFFVPIRQLWQQFPEFITQMNEPVSMIGEVFGDSYRGAVPSSLPYFSLKSFIAYCANNNDIESGGSDDLGYPKTLGCMKLLNYLKYSKVPFGLNNSQIAGLHELYCNPFRALAYQKIYNDFYRDPNWERPAVYSYNIDDYSSAGQPNYIDNMKRLISMFTLRYVNLKKDYFTGLRPSPTFGDVSVLNLPVFAVNSANTAAQNVVTGVTPHDFNGTSGKYVYTSGYSSSSLKAQISMLELRQAQALQRWKDISLSNRRDYAHQMKAHFGENVSQAESPLVQFIDGITTNMQIDQVTSTTPGNAGQLGEVGAKLQGFNGSNKEFEFTAPDFGYFVVMYYILPLPDYSTFGVDRFNTKLHADDFYMAEFENLGLQPVESYELNYYKDRNVDTGGQSDFLRMPLGYSNRYLEYKGTYDFVLDDFNKGGGNEQYVIQFTPQNDGSMTLTTNVDYTYFKAKPSMLAPIFVVPYDGQLDTENFRNTTYLSIKTVESMSVDGMPY